MKFFLCFFIVFSGCRSTSAFLTPNEVLKTKVILLFRNQEKRTGIIDIHHENYNSVHVVYSEFIEFIPEGKDTIEKINMNDISGYWFDSIFYALKKLDVQMTNTYRLLFVKRLTEVNSKIQLYELYESGQGNETGEYNFTYYISLPSYGPYEAVNTRSSALIPYFDKKMSAMVEDCPALSRKILAKENGYFIPMTSFNRKKHPEVLLKIINEYNNCK